jgi:hypothetical protein
MARPHHHIKLWFDRLLSKSLWRQLLLLAVALVIAFGFSFVLLSFSGAEWTNYCQKEHLSKWLLPLYLLIDSNALNNLYIGSDGTFVKGWMLIASSITFLIGAFIFNGAIIGIITNSIEQRVESHRNGHLHYLNSGHYIIMGYDEMVPSIITHIFEKDPGTYILMMSATESETIRERLLKVFDEKQLEHIIINYGHRMSKNYYKDIHVEAAKQVYIVGMRALPAHDAINVECVDSICAYLEQPEVTGHPQRITCVFEDLDTYAAFKTSEIFVRVKDLGIEFVPYNFYSGWAKQVFIKRHYKDLDRPGIEIPYPSVYGRKEDGKFVGITDTDKRFVHLVFVGTSNFAVAFAMEAAHVLHFPNFKSNGSPCTKITFIDINADKEKDVFIARNKHYFEIQAYSYKDLSDITQEICTPPLKKTGREHLRFHGDDANFLDIEFEFIKGDVFSFEVQNLISEWAKDTDNQYLSIFLAQADQRQNFILGMNMPDEVYDNEINVFIRQDRSDNFVTNLRFADEKQAEDPKKNTYYQVKNGTLFKTEPKGGRYSHIYPFGMNETAYSADEKSLLRAKLINYLYSTARYEFNRFQSILALDAMSPSQIWKEADEYWKDLSVALKWSNLYNAYTIRIKLNSLRAMRDLDIEDTSRDTWPLSEQEVELMARVEHNRWNVEKLLMGYRKPYTQEDKYVPENAEFKSELKMNKNRFIHHDIRPFESLDGIQELDKEFSRYIPWIVKMTSN